MDGLFDIGYDFLAEAATAEAREREERDIRTLNEILEFWGKPFRAELNPETMDVQDRNGLDGIFIHDDGEQRTFDTKHYPSVEGTGLVAFQLLRRVVGFGKWMFGWGFHGASECIIWWDGDEKCHVFSKGELEHSAVDELRSNGFEMDRMNVGDQEYLNFVADYAAADGSKSPGHLSRYTVRSGNGSEVEVVILYISLSDIQGVASYHTPTSDEIFRKAQMDREWEAKAGEREEARQEEMWRKRFEKANRRAEVLFRQISDRLASPQNSFPTGYFKWSTLLKTLIFYEPRNHRTVPIDLNSEKFNLKLDPGSTVHQYGLGFSHDRWLNGLFSDVRELIGTLHPIAMPKTMSKLRSNLERLKLIGPGEDADAAMRAITTQTETVHYKDPRFPDRTLRYNLWDEGKRRGMVPVDDAKPQAADADAGAAASKTGRGRTRAAV